MNITDEDRDALLRVLVEAERGEMTDAEWGYARREELRIETIYVKAILASDAFARIVQAQKPVADREAVLLAILWAMLSNGPTIPSGKAAERFSEIPAGEMFRLARDFVAEAFASGVIREAPPAEVTDAMVEAAAKAIKPLFLSAGLVDLDAEDYAWDAARAALGAVEPGR